METCDANNERVIDKGEKICDCPECGAEIINGIGDSIVLKASKLFHTTPAISRERLVEIINSKLYVQKDNGNTFEVYPAMEIKGVDGAADAILSELGAKP